MTEQLTAEQIAQHYSAAMDSVNLLNAGQPEDMSDDETGLIVLHETKNI